ncbi:MAG: tRNA-binding protein [Gemmatimonadetes bacterium]|nr:tRNA-binding protein [Gemmatimonadota bacterium]NIO32001.1 tRNA-binding protein [Gemmatimonadota bacterium]
MAEFKPAPLKPAVPFDVFQQIDVRVGSIAAVDDIPSSGKLLKLTVDFGDHQRTIVAGLKKERPDRQALVGVQALFVINLEPRKMAGELSEGMLFDLGYPDGIRPVFAVPEAAVPNGARAG